MNTMNNIHKTRKSEEDKAYIQALLKEARELDAFLDNELKSLEKGLLDLKQEVINKLADKPASEKD